MAPQAKTTSRWLSLFLLGSLLTTDVSRALANPAFMVPHGLYALPSTQVQWIGVAQTTTYAGAESICTNNGLRLCYRAEYCPYGHAGGEDIYGGGKKSGDQWAAVKDQVNNWVQVGTLNWPSCQLHTEINGGAHGLPSWSTDPSAHGFRNWVLCCAL